ncbi:MAG: hypothetical protein HC769_22770 [Cyanobacteria bacterium CRU_2_1]|nr:hypothetical protein [Cyanobacteria bacterium CRU_2_1]
MLPGANVQNPGDCWQLLQVTTFLRTQQGREYFAQGGNMSTASQVKMLNAIDNKFVWVAPVVAASLYPVFLMGLFQSGELIRSATDSVEAIVGTVALVLSLLLSYGVPATGFAVAYRLGQIQDPSQSQIRVRRLVHLVFASPPLFTCIGVILFVLGITNNTDYLIWAIIWIPIVVLTFRSRAIGTRMVFSPVVNWQRLKGFRAVHGISALLILLIYLVPHIANHLTAIWNVDTHLWVMDSLRQWYRTDVIEPIVGVMFICQVLTGLILWRPRTTHQSDLFGTLQTTSGAFLMVFITSHTMAVFC